MPNWVRDLAFVVLVLWLVSLTIVQANLVDVVSADVKLGERQLELISKLTDVGEEHQKSIEKLARNYVMEKGQP